MAENVFTKTGGKVHYTPEKVKSDLTAPYEYSNEDQIRNIALQRDLTAANLLENDILLDTLDAAIDEQMKEFALTVPELYEAATNLCGGPTVTWECYKKAKELLRIAPWIAYGYDPVQLTFTDKFQKRAGNVVFDCKKFDPDEFQNIDLSVKVDEALGTNEELGEETPSEIEKRAQENQKKWALLVLFWDLLWGKAVVKPGIPDDQAMAKSVEAVNAEIQKLRSEGKNAEADAMAKRLAQSENLPNTIMVDRPRITNQLQWSDKNGDPIEFNLKSHQDSISVEAGTQAWVDNAAAVWIDAGRLFDPTTSNDVFKNKSIPAIKSGFILSILVGFLGLVPKANLLVLKARSAFLDSIAWIKNWKVPVIRKKILKDTVWKPLKWIVSIGAGVMSFISNIFIEICIWLALLPNTYIPNVSDVEEIKQVNTGLNQSMEVQPTPAGFISLDCFKAAQEIVNRVNQEATN